MKLICSKFILKQIKHLNVQPSPDAECSVTHPTDLKTHQTVTKDEQNGCKKVENHLGNGELPNGAVRKTHIIVIYYIYQIIISR